MLSFDSDILDVHDIMLHDYGMGRIFAVAHAEVPAERELVAIHNTVDALEKAVEVIEAQEKRIAELEKKAE